MPDQPTPKSELVIVPPDGGSTLNAFGEHVVIKLGGGQTGGSLSLWTEVTPPGLGPPPHYHVNEDELFLVQQGRVEFLLKGQWVEPGEGATVYIPRGNVHTFRNAGDTPSRIWVMASPSGFEKFFGRCAAEFARPGGPDMPKIMSISAEHGIHFVEPG
jgi:quercetin dioxygenase-like cupin family protein